MRIFKIIICVIWGIIFGSAVSHTVMSALMPEFSKQDFIEFLGITAFSLATIICICSKVNIDPKDN